MHRSLMAAVLGALLLIPSVSFAQVPGPPPVYVNAGGSRVPAPTQTLMGFDSSSGLSCIVGITGTCQLQTSAVPMALTQCFGNAASSFSCKSSPGNLYLVEVANTTADAWVSVYNATAGPTNGVQTFGTGTGNVQACFKAPTGTSSSRGGLPMPINFTTGITIAVSSTACGTLTLATTAIVIGYYN